MELLLEFAGIVGALLAVYLIIHIRHRRQGAVITPARKAFSDAERFEFEQNYDAAREAYQEARKFYDQDGDHEGVAGALVSLGIMERGQGELELARSLFLESQVVSEQNDNRYGVAMTCFFLGDLACQTGSYDEARAAFSRALKIYEEADDREDVANIWMCFGRLEKLQGNYDAARSAFSKCMEIYRETGNQENEQWAADELSAIDEVE